VPSLAVRFEVLLNVDDTGLRLVGGHNGIFLLDLPVSRRSWDLWE